MNKKPVRSKPPTQTRNLLSLCEESLTPKKKPHLLRGGDRERYESDESNRDDFDLELAIGG